MVLFISFLIGIQIIHMLPASAAPSFVYPSCNSLVVKAAAELALDKINSNRKQGYVLGLQRIFDVHELPQDDWSLFNLVLDVLETKCHVLSRKPWKKCAFRKPYLMDFGRCNVVIIVNRKTKDSFVHKNECILCPFSTPACPGCPIRQDPSEESYQEIARESLAKFNAEKGHTHCFAIVEVTKASSQVINGILEAVEFTIQETSCNKSMPVTNITQCPLLPLETGKAGLCHGSAYQGVGTSKTVSVHCDLFPPPPSVKDGQTSQSGSEPQKLQYPHISQEKVEVVIDYYPSSNHDLPDIGSTFAPPQQEAKPILPPYLKRLSGSAKCPGKDAIEIPGLHFPCPQQAKTTQTKSAI